MQHKIEMTREAFDEIYPVVEKLKSKTIHNFIEICSYCIDDEIRKKSQSIASKMSRTSSIAGLNPMYIDMFIFFKY